MTATFGKLAFNFPLLSQVPGASEANKQFIGRKIGSFYHRITLRRPINLHLDCQYSIDRPIIASMELRKKSSGSISILHLSFSRASRGSRGYEIWTNGPDYFLSLHFLCSLFPAGIITYILLQQIYGELILDGKSEDYFVSLKIWRNPNHLLMNSKSCILENMQKSKSCTGCERRQCHGIGFILLAVTIYVGRFVAR